MKKAGFIFEIGQLIRSEQGTSYKFELDDEVAFEIDKNAEVKSNVQGFVSFMKVDRGILVEITALYLQLELKCMRCTKKFTHKIISKSASRVFLFERKKKDSDVFDEYFVEMKSFSIDITDFLRQEIILHFPMIPVCSSSCKGLCPLCGKKLNDGDCGCKANKPTKLQLQTHKPLSILKDLYKE
jgi:uncharacterized metal-binding protein YceD (DUF177 family)